MSRHPPELDDVDWLQERYARGAGDQTIARELGCARQTVQAARQRAGIAARPPGRYLAGQAPRVRTPPAPTLIASRFALDKAGEVAPTRELFSMRLRALLDAEAADDELAQDDCWVGLASAAGLVYEHRQRLKRSRSV